MPALPPAVLPLREPPVPDPDVFMPAAPGVFAGVGESSLQATRRRPLTPKPIANRFIW
jgi:hypothetical protein